MSKAPSIPDPPEPSPDERPEPGEPHSRHRRWAWWHRQQPLTRKSVRAVALLLITGLAAGVVGIFTAEASSSLGPHAASYSVSARHEVMLDLGPLGAIIIDSRCHGRWGSTSWSRRSLPS